MSGHTGALWVGESKTFFFVAQHETQEVQDSIRFYSNVDCIMLH